MGWGSHREVRLAGWFLVPAVGSTLLAQSFYTVAGKWLVVLNSIAVTEILLVFADVGRAAKSRALSGQGNLGHNGERYRVGIRQATGLGELPSWRSFLSRSGSGGIRGRLSGMRPLSLLIRWRNHLVRQAKAYNQGLRAVR